MGPTPEVETGITGYKELFFQTKTIIPDVFLLLIFSSVNHGNVRENSLSLMDKPQT
jgi:hypothetical protein